MLVQARVLYTIQNNNSKSDNIFALFQCNGNHCRQAELPQLYIRPQNLMTGPDDPSPLHTRSDSQSLPDTWEPACNQVSGSKYFMFHIYHCELNFYQQIMIQHGMTNVPSRLITRIAVDHITPSRSNRNIWCKPSPVPGMAKVISTSTRPYNMLQNLISRGKEDSRLVLYVTRFSQAQF